MKIPKNSRYGPNHLSIYLACMFVLACINADEEISPGPPGISDVPGGVPSASEQDQSKNNPVANLSLVHYQSCLNSSDIESRGIQTIVAILEKLGGWFIVMPKDERKPNDHSWQEIDKVYTRLTGDASLFKIDVRKSEQSQAEYLITVDEPDFALQEALQTQESVEEYKRLIGNVARIFVKFQSSTVSIESINQEIEQMVEFEQKLYEIAQRVRQILSDREATLQISQFQERYNIRNSVWEVSQIHWLDIIRNLFRDTNVEIHSNEMISFKSSYYIYKLVDVLNATPISTIINYIHWHFIRNMLQYGDKNMVELDKKFKNILRKSVAEETRNIICEKERQLAISILSKIHTTGNTDIAKKDFPKLGFHYLDNVLLLKNRAVRESLQKLRNPDSSLVGLQPHKVDSTLIPAIPSNKCASKICKRTALDLDLVHNYEVEPCDNFYEYSCGNYHLTNFNNELTALESANLNRSSAILSDSFSPLDSQSLRKAKIFYKQCMDNAILNEYSISAVLDVINSQGGWSLLSTKLSTESTHTWQSILNFYAQYGIFSLFKISLRPVEKAGKSTWYLALDPPDLPMPPGSLNNKLVEAKYRMYMDKIVEAFSKVAKVGYVYNPQIDNIILFEKELTKIVLLNNRFPSNDNLNDHITTLENWISIMNEVTKSQTGPNIKFNWLNAIREVFSLTNVQISKSTPLLITNRNYFTALVNLLKTTPRNRIVKYLHWNFIYNMLPYGSTLMRKIASDINFEYYGITTNPRRNLECTEQNPMKLAIYHAFLQKHFSKESKNLATDIFLEIQSKVETIARNMKWLDDTGKYLMTLKFDQLKSHIGYPITHDINPNFDYYYSQLIINEQLPYIDNILSYKKFQLKNQLENLQKTVDETEAKWDSYTDMANRFGFKPDTYSISFPAHILQPPLFSLDLPIAMNYGAIGALMGQEIFRAILNVFQSYFNTIDEAEKIEDFHCFIDQLKSTPFGTIASLIPENLERSLVTTVGLQAAYEAYKEASRKQGFVDKKLERFIHRSGDELFFMAFAHAHCTVHDPKSANSGYAAYNPSQLIILDAIKHSKFKTAFQCLSTQQMSYETKCTL
ncbi:endothelin-converting enzyme 1 [Orussus abietinus]|uniref:endothelin-converting enzyme 1 n=1 Tax=Orussus abietinus TaxID=222816 RepID=UPI000625003F|nr:endothelin-converting enzyme 1 [Orussus abietinus]